ncbi:butirosin biosynthesis protein H-like [Fontibacillus phaseoli]|uniref:Butirosin biosynthesis protein H-like n=1 Tax=Fontibacillus phaseoli TaxID=1416533 RepID=A0A369BCD9_9BACL|nr:BtrH N-terminal domain-containing protein [Fontibacillus phaseoli]RCX17334.1 butirosin biosynthesis protein H-like [Fontibacillus phaseoli]
MPKLDIRPDRLERIPSRHFEYYSCLEDSVKTLTRWLGHDCELMFQGSWNFSFGRRGWFHKDWELSFRRWKFDWLDRIYGVKLTSRCTDVHSDLQMIGDELRQGTPVILAVDCYWVPWDSGFQMNHNGGHCSVVAGMDEAKRELTCVDGYFLRKDAVMPYDCLEKGYKGFWKIELNDRPSPAITPPRVRQMLLEQAQRFKKHRMYEQMAFFGSSISTSREILIRDEAQHQELGRTRWWGIIGRVADGRVEYCLFLRHLAAHLEKGEEALREMAAEVWACGEQWHLIKALLEKAALSHPDRQHDLFHDAADRIRRVALKEQQISQQLLLQF